MYARVLTERERMELVLLQEQENISKERKNNNNLKKKNLEEKTENLLYLVPVLLIKTLYKNKTKHTEISFTFLLLDNIGSKYLI